MAKKNAETVNKITDLELAKLRELVNQRQKVLNELASIEVAKYNLLKETDNLQNYFDGLGKELEDKYGKVNVNLENGEYTLNEEEQK